MATGAKPRRLVKRSGGPPPSAQHGELDLLYAKDMEVLAHIQRTPLDSRLRQLAGAWDVTKEGIIFVAKITDGDHVGTLHPYDGGTRVVSQQKYGDPDHIFTCWVKEMTEKEAADAFLTFNMLSRKPSAYSQYVVALEADHDWAHAIQKATSALGVTVAEHPTGSKLAAIKAAERIVENRRFDDLDEASDHLLVVLETTMASYPGSHEAFDADLIQAVSRIILDNEALINLRRLTERIASRSMGRWRTQAQNARGMADATSGGSESRSLHLRRELIGEYNKRLAEANRLS